MKKSYKPFVVKTPEPGGRGGMGGLGEGDGGGGDGDNLTGLGGGGLRSASSLLPTAWVGY